jgi:hypothetical protein
MLTTIIQFVDLNRADGLLKKSSSCELQNPGWEGSTSRVERMMVTSYGFHGDTSQ